MTTLLWTAIGFLSGSIPFSLLVGRWFARADVRRYGDGNPGATNAWRVGGWRVGVVALLLDCLKGFIPVGLAHFRCGVSGWPLVPVTLAPVLGHAFSPFLRFRGGKAVAATFGIWTGLTLGEAPIVMGASMALFYWVQSADAWAVILTMSVLLAHILLRRTDGVTLAVWVGNVALLLWKHRHGLRERPRPREWVSRLVGCG
jgi:glycerol-3-phosphate acyltransferase PlsY